MIYIFVFIVVLLSIVFVNQKIEDLKENKKRKHFFQRINDFYSQYYEIITEGITSKYPYIKFAFLDYPDYKSKYFVRLINVRHSEKKTIHTVIEPLIEYARLKYVDHTREFEILKIEKDGSDFWKNEEKYRTTKNGRNPKDWNFRRELIFKRDRGQCQRCGKKEEISTCHIHHVVRRADNGNHSLENLVVLCKSCHTLMDGHSKMQSFRDYYVSRSKIIHTKKCHHALKSKKKTTSYGMLRNKGLKGCQICRPWAFHERAKSEWKYEIEYYIHKTIKNYREKPTHNNVSYEKH